MKICYDRYDKNGGAHLRYRHKKKPKGAFNSPSPARRGLIAFSNLQAFFFPSHLLRTCHIVIKSPSQLPEPVTVCFHQTIICGPETELSHRLPGRSFFSSSLVTAAFFSPTLPLPADAHSACLIGNMLLTSLGGGTNWEGFPPPTPPPPPFYVDGLVGVTIWSECGTHR